jgi:hypothetical protein
MRRKEWRDGRGGITLGFQGMGNGRGGGEALGRVLGRKKREAWNSRGFLDWVGGEEKGERGV